MRRSSICQLVWSALIVIAGAAGCTSGGDDCAFLHPCSFPVASPCEIVSFTTTCKSPMTCAGAFCHINPTVDESCAITVVFDDKTTSTTQVAITPPASCTCSTVVAKAFSMPVGSKCSPPSFGTDASTSDADASDSQDGD